MKNTGPLESSLINIPMIAKIGIKNTKANPLAKMSNILFIINVIFFSSSFF